MSIDNQNKCLTGLNETETESLTDAQIRAWGQG